MASWSHSICGLVQHLTSWFNREGSHRVLTDAVAVFREAWSRGGNICWYLADMAAFNWSSGQLGFLQSQVVLASVKLFKIKLFKSNYSKPNYSKSNYSKSNYSNQTIQNQIIQNQTIQNQTIQKVQTRTRLDQTSLNQAGLQNAVCK